MKTQQQVHLEYSDNSYNHFVQLEPSFLGFIMRISLSQKVGYTAMEQSSTKESSRTREPPILVETLSFVEFMNPKLTKYRRDFQETDKEVTSLRKRTLGQKIKLNLRILDFVSKRKKIRVIQDMDVGTEIDD